MPNLAKYWRPTCGGSRWVCRLLTSCRLWGCCFPAESKECNSFTRQPESLTSCGGLDLFDSMRESACPPSMVHPLNCNTQSEQNVHDFFSFFLLFSVKPCGGPSTSLGPGKPCATGLVTYNGTHITAAECKTLSDWDVKMKQGSSLVPDEDKNQDNFISF